MKVWATLLVSAGLMFGSSAMAKNQTFEVKAKQSALNWTGSKVVGSKHTGTVDIKSGKVTYDGDKPVNAEVVVAMASINNEDLTDPQWNKKLVDHLKSDDFFSVDKYGEAKIVATGFKSLGNGNFEVTGKLTIKGKTQPITFKAQETQTKMGRKISADLTFDRTLFDVRYGSGKFFDNLGDKMISDDVQLKVNLQLGNTAIKTAQK